MELAKSPQVKEMVSLNLDADVIKDLRNPELDSPITTAVWAKHNAGIVSSLVNKLNKGKGLFL